jgi:hypothetical protein
MMPIAFPLLIPACWPGRSCIPNSPAKSAISVNLDQPTTQIWFCPSRHEKLTQLCGRPHASELLTTSTTDASLGCSRWWG